MNHILQENITPHFKWKEALYLPEWDVHAYPENQQQIDNIISLCKVLEHIRHVVQSPLVITSFYRPPLYNKLKKGAKRSAHLEGLAADFVPKNQSLNTVKQTILPLLDALNCRMEDDPRERIHIDLKSPGRSGRFFKP